MNFRFLIAAALAASALNGCASTKISGAGDPKYHGFKAQSIVIFARGFNYDVQQRIEEGVCSQIASQVRCFSSYSVFPPTRTHTKEEIYRDLIHNNIDVGVIVAYGNEMRNSTVMGYSTNGQATTNYYSFSNQAVTTYSGTTMPIISNTRQMSADVAFVKVETKENIYVGQMSTFGGDFATGDAAFANAMVKKLTQEIRARLLAQ